MVVDPVPIMVGVALASGVASAGLGYVAHKADRALVELGASLRSAFGDVETSAPDPDADLLLAMNSRKDADQ
ncbi:MAG: hypothetical protein INF91_10685 [Alphaproteobacteria bacterium]|nr:hypothetical protein [Alphaproteobacteria bacterium]